MISKKNSYNSQALPSRPTDKDDLLNLQMICRNYKQAKQNVPFNPYSISMLPERVQPDDDTHDL